MSEAQGEVRVRNVATRRSEGFVESAVEFGGGVLRLGLSVITLPLALLPRDTRGHLRNATRDILVAFATLPADLASVAGEAVEEWAREGDAAATAPRDEMTPA